MPVIPKEQLTAYQRWELAAFEEPGQAVAPVESAPPPPVVPEPAVEVIEEVPLSVALPTAEELERIHEEARLEGYALGLEEGRQSGQQAGYEEGRRKGEAHAQQLSALVAALEGEQLRQDEQLAAEVLDLALMVTRQLVRSSLEVRPELILPAIREAMASLPTLSGHLRIMVNPADAGTVREWLAHEHGHLSSKIIEDARVDRGGFRFETNQSELNAEWPGRWQEIVERLGSSRGWVDPS